MTLQNKVTAIVLALWVLFIALSVVIQQRLVLPSYHSLEQERADQNLERVVQAIERESEHLATTASDWGVWTPLWEWLDRRDQAFEEDNLRLNNLVNLDVDLLYVYDATGAVAWGMAVDPSSEARRPMPDLDGVVLPAGHPFRSTGDTRQSAQGILQTAVGPVLVGARAVVTTEGNGPARGMIVFGRFLDEGMLAALQAQVRLPFALVPVVGAAPAAVLDSRDTAVVFDPDTMHITHLLRDVHRQPAQVLHLDLPRSVTAFGRRTIRAATGHLAVAGFCTLAALVIILHFLVLKPLRRLTGHVIGLGREEARGRLALARRDELGVLGRELDRMADQLAEARRRLAEQSYSSGVAEMAAGLLHNIGNSMTPLTVQAEQLRRELQEAPVADLELALGELSRPGLPPGRRDDLGAFAGVAVGGLRQSLERASGAATAVAGQVRHISGILADQERFSRAGRVLETFALDELLRETVGLLDERHLARLEIRRDPSVRRAGSAPLARVALQQVFANLMINAAEAVRPVEERGLLVVRADPELLEGRRMLRLAFADDGVGIEAGHLALIFERGFSSKPEGRRSGLGLHWSSNTLHALGGSIHAESAGPGRGAVFHVLIPWEPAAATPAAPRVAATAEAT